jgi:Lipopolysaccharide kinase (Kdo/WaaP) family
MASEDRPQYTISDVALNGEKGAEIGVFTNGRRFHIEFLPIDLRQPGRSRPSNVELEYLALVKAVHGLIGDETGSESSGQSTEGRPSEQAKGAPKADDSHLKPCNGYCSEDPLEAWILRPFIQQRILQTFAPASSKPLLSTLHDRIYPPTLSFKLKWMDGKPVPVQIPNQHASLAWYSLPRDISKSRYWSKYPQAEPKDVFLIDQSHPQNPNLVMFEGKKCWFKAVHAMVPGRAFAREIDILTRIQEAGLCSRIRVPRLNGLVTETNDGRIQALLLDAVDNHSTIWERYNDPLPLRKKWYDSVTQMLRQLHEADIVWGDVKLSNLLTDEKNDVWLVDFGGGSTRGWVDFENMETKEGDLQGLAEFKKFLRLA